MKFLGLSIFFIFLIAYYRKKGTRLQEDLEESFWVRENEANHSRRKDISGLPYITIPEELFTMDICDSSELLKDFSDTLSELATKKILNLENQSNTDLKLKYGPANLDVLTEYEQNFTTLCSTIVAFSEKLLELGHTEEALSVLEFGISCGSDHSKNYRILADLYSERKDLDKLTSLFHSAKELTSPMKASILTHIEDQIVAIS